MSRPAFAALVLAAGASRRLGRPKQLLRWKGATLLRRALDGALAAGASPVVCVLGAEADACLSEIVELPVHVVLHEGWSEGMGSSLRTGVAALEELVPGAVGTLVLTCDQPLVTAALLGRLVAAAEAPGSPLVACRYVEGAAPAAGVGPPAFFPRRCFSELAALTGDSGARVVLRRHVAELVTVEFPGGAFDVDDEEDLARLLALPPEA